MEAKLIKKSEELFELFTQGFLKGSTNHGLIDSLNAEDGNVRYKLSLSNCQAIERGYDLDELSEKAIGDIDHPCAQSDLYLFKLGFQKALELMGDKKFTISDLKKSIDMSRIMIEGKYAHPSEDIYQSLQQTEWDVVIETYDTSLCGFPTSFKEGLPIGKPKLDENGCLILKRK